MNPLVLTGLLVTITLAALGVIEVREQRRPGSAQRVELRFGRDVTPEAVLAVLRRIAGLHRFACLSLEVRADHNGIRQFMAADQATIDSLATALRSHLPSAQVLPAAVVDVTPVMAGGAVRLRGRLRTLGCEAPEELSAALLGSLQPLGQQEHIVLRWLVKSSKQMTVPSARDGQLVEPEERKRIQTKNADSVLLVHGTVAAQAEHPKRAAHLLARVTSVLRTRNKAYGQLQSRPRPRFWLTWLLTRRSFMLGDRFNVNELAGFIGWPMNAPMLPGVAIGTSPRRIPAARIPRNGQVIGEATWHGGERPIAQPIVGALSHRLIPGPTGVGKSTLVVNLIEQDLQAGRGVVLIDGKGDTASAILERVPVRRHDEVILLDAGMDGPQPGLRLFGAGDPELAADVVLGVLSDLYKHEWGPLSERYLRAALVAVAHDDHGSLADVPYVFTDAAYRRKLVARLSDPLTISTFAGFDAMGNAERQQQIAAPLNKLGQLLGRPIVRTVLGQPEPKLDFLDVLRRGKIVLISLAPARVGGPAARLIGALSVFGLFQAVQSRSSLAAGKRFPFMVYVDEPRALGDLPMPLDALLETARGLGVSVSVSPQSMKQLPGNVRDAVMTNVATRIVFRQDSDDARLLARDLAGIEPDDLGDLGQYEAVARINLGPGDLAPPVTIRTLKPSKPMSDAQALARDAAGRYGRCLADVDAALMARHTVTPGPAVGRKRRTP